MQNWTELYKELASNINDGIEAIKWIDLWHNQVNFLADEHPFPTPASFLSFRTRRVEDLGQGIQQPEIQVDAYIFYETYADTYEGSINQDSALDFMNLLDEHQELLHDTSGDFYSNMRWIGTAPVDTGSTGNLYRISFECLMAI